MLDAGGSGLYTGFMDLNACLNAQGEDVFLAVKVQPRASRNELGPLMGAELKVKVTAPPVDSKANDALLLLLAQTLDVPKSKVQLAKGQSSRRKVIRISGLALEDIKTRLRLGMRLSDTYI